MDSADERYIALEKMEWDFYSLLVRSIATLLLASILAITAYNMADRTGPVRPFQHMTSSWPDGTPSKGQ